VASVIFPSITGAAARSALNAGAVARPLPNPARPAWNDSDSGHLSFPRAHRPSGMRCSRLSTFAFITPRSASVTCRFCPGRRRSPPRRYIAQRHSCSQRLWQPQRSARAELGDAWRLVAADLRDCHQCLVEGRCSEADRRYQSLASPPSELPAAVIAPV
jgi:hypothetical protein